VNWRRTDLGLLFAMLVLWGIATLFDLIGNTKFIGHVSMLALVLAALSAWRSDAPNPKEKEKK
jgi:hypothetical protein